MQTFDWSSSKQGLIFLTFEGPTLFCPLVGEPILKYPNVAYCFHSPSTPSLIGRLIDRHGPRIPAATGFLICTPLLVALRFITHNSTSQQVLLCTLLTGLGFGLMLIMPALMTEMIHAVQAEQEGLSGTVAQANGLYSSAFAGGMLLGPIWAGFMKQWYGWETMGWTLGVATGFSTLLVLLSFREQCAEQA